MAAVILLQASPRSAATGAPVAVRLAGGGSRPFNQLGFSDWRSGLTRARRPLSALEFDAGGPTGVTLPQTTLFRFAPSDGAQLSALAGLFWERARVTVAIGDDEAAAPAYPTELVGTIASARTEGAALILAVADLSGDLAKPIAPGVFAGTGGLEGPVEAAGRVKRRSWGKVFNIEGRLLDKAANIYEFGDPGRPINGFPAVRDKGRAATSVGYVAWHGTAALTLAALIASSPAEGGCVVSPSIACVKWWTQPVGPLTADLEGEVGAGYVATAPAIAAALATALAPDITVANLASAIGWQDRTAGVHVGDGAQSAASVIDRLLLPLFIGWTLSGAGALSFRRFHWDEPSAASLVAESVERIEILAPVRERRLGYRRNHRRHSDSEISAAVLADDVQFADGTPLPDAIADAGRTAVWSEVDDDNGSRPADGATRNRTFHADGPPTFAGAPGDFWREKTIGGPAIVYLFDDGAWQVAATEGAQAGTNLVDGNGVVLTDSAIRNFERFWDMGYPDVAAIAADFELVGPGEVTLVPATDTGGQAIQFGDAFGDDRVDFLARHWTAFSPDGLYELTFDVELLGAGPNARMYLGFQAVDRAGNNLGETYNYCAASALVQADAGGRHVFRAWIRGTGPVGSAVLGSSPSAPTVAPDGSVAGFGQGGTVKIRPIGLVNYSSSGVPASGRVRLHSMSSRRLAGGLAAKDVASLDTDVADGALHKRYQLIERNKLGGIEAGADVTASAQVSLTATVSKTIAADHTGTIATGLLPATVPAPKVVRGGIDVSTAASTAYAIQNATGGCVGKVSVDNAAGSTSKGVQTIASGWSSSGTYELIVAVAGVALPPVKVTVTKSIADPPTGGGGGGGGGSGGKSGSISTGGATLSSTSFIQVGRLNGLTVAAGELVKFAWSEDYDISGASANVGSRSVVAKAQISVAGASSWSDIADAVTGSPSTFNASSGESTIGSITVTQTAAPAAGSYDVRLMAAASATLTTGVLALYGTNANVVVET